MALGPAAQRRRLLDGMDRLLAVDSFDALQATMLDVLGSLIDCDHVVYNELDPELCRAVTLFDDPMTAAQFGAKLPAFARHMGEHPILNHVRAYPAAPPLRLSDFLSQPRLHDLALYQEVYKPLATEFQAVVHLSVPSRVTVGIALNREGRDFSDRETALLARLQPVLQRTYGSVRRRHLARLLLEGRSDERLIEALVGFGLTEREAEACLLLVLGKSNAEIGTLLGISPLTAKTHAEHVLRKLGVGNRVDATRQVIARLLDLP